MTKNILIVKGGKYAEAEVSRKTAINVEIALNAKGYNTTFIEPQENLISYLNDNKQNIDIRTGLNREVIFFKKWIFFRI